MTNETREILQQEWSTLQNNCAHSESLALLIKLVAVIVCFFYRIFDRAPHQISEL